MPQRTMTYLEVTETGDDQPRATLPANAQDAWNRMKFRVRLTLAAARYLHNATVERLYENLRGNPARVEEIGKNIAQAYDLWLRLGAGAERDLAYLEDVLSDLNEHGLADDKALTNLDTWREAIRRPLIHV